MSKILKPYDALEDLLQRNRGWSARMRQDNPDFFTRLADQQAPRIFWIGCSDSRVPATQILDLQPGEIFVHRNIANIVDHTDLNGLSALQFAVEILHVEHIIVCGHYGCGGVGAVLRDESLGLIDSWLQHIQNVRHTFAAKLSTLGNDTQQHARLCELNALTQAARVCQTSIVQDAWLRGQTLQIHGWIYSLADGHISDLGFHVQKPEDVDTMLASTTGALFQEK